MQMDLENGGGMMIRSYTPGKLTINDELITRNIILDRDEIIADWNPGEFETLGASDFELALARKPEVILFGTGETQRFPNGHLLTDIARLGIGFEAMNTAAACRTFNVLSSEHRHVIAVLII
jgi:uncharacterized protein